MKRKHVITAGITALMMLAATGCGTGQDTKSEAVMLPVTYPVEDSATENTPNAQTPEKIEKPENTENTENDDTQNATKDQTDFSEETIYIGGKVRSIAQDSFVISRTLVEDGMVTMPEPGSPEEQLVTIRCTDETVFEHWTIQGGGAGIDKKDAVFSDIQEGGGLEAEGHFEGETFVADKVIIEVYQ